MAGVKKVEVIERKIVAVTDCGQTEPTLYELDCGCDDDDNPAPPPVQGEGTPCNVSDYLSKQMVSFFAQMIPALQAYNTSEFWIKCQAAANAIGLGAYVLQISNWASNIGALGQINATITQYYAYSAKQAHLQCWLLGCLPATGEMSESVLTCWRDKIRAAKTTYPAYTAWLDAIHGFTAIFTMSLYQQLASAGSTINARCNGCSDTACAPGEWMDWRQVNDLRGWVGITGQASEFPLNKSAVWGNYNFAIVPPDQTNLGLQSPDCTAGECTATGISFTFTTPIKLCYAYILEAVYLANGNLQPLNTSWLGIFYAKADGVKVALAEKRYLPGDPAAHEAEWSGGIADVKTLYILIRAGGSRATLLKTFYNSDNAANLPTITGVPYVAKPVVSVPANVNQAGWDALFATEAAGRIYELEGVMSNVAITPRAGDVFRPKFGKTAKFYGGNNPAVWTLDTGTTYWATYSRAINKAGAGGNGLVNGIYQINDEAAYPRAHWMIAVRSTVTPGNMLRHVATLADCRANSGSYFVDEATSRVYVNISAPISAGLINITHTKNAFVLTANGVILENLWIDLYAPDFQEGMVQTASPLMIGGTQLLGCQIDWSACNGVKLGTGSKILDNTFGVSGMTSAVFQGNDVVFSGNVQTGLYNEQHTNEGYEAAFEKSSRTINAVITNNTLRLGGDGKGLWDDLGCVYTLYADNVIQLCSRAGVMSELAFATRVIRNRILDCMKAQTGQPQRGEILIVNTQGWNGQKVLVQENTVVNFGNGGAFFGLTQSNRGTGTAPDGSTVTYLTKDVDVSYNEFYCRDIATGVQKSGTYQDYDPNTNFNTLANGLVADHNAYHMSSSLQMFQQGGANKTMAQWQALNGTVLVADPNSTIDQAAVPAEVDA